jgi:hypothetical protein
MYAYFKHPRQKSGRCSHTMVVAGPEVFRVNYYQSYFKKDGRAGSKLDKLIESARLAPIASTPDYIKDTAASYKRSGRVHVKRKLLTEFFGLPFTHNIQKTVEGVISVYISKRKKLLDVTLTVHTKNVEFQSDSANILKLSDHHTFSNNPDKETSRKHLKMGIFNYLSSGEEKKN